jgi:hypothetical protein
MMLDSRYEERQTRTYYFDDIVSMSISIQEYRVA